MRILIFVETFSPLSETFVYNYITQLQKHASLKVVCFNRSNEDVFPFSPIEILPQIRSKLKRKLNRTFVYYNYANPNTQRKLSLLINEFKPDLIFSFFFNHSLHVYDNLFIKIPLFVMVLGYDASSLLNFRLYRRKLKNVCADKNVFPIFVSEALQKNFEKHKIKLLNSTVLPLCTDTDFFYRKNSHTKKGKVCFTQVSRFTEKKGHHITLKAFSEFKIKFPTKPFELRFIGDGIELDKIKALSLNLNLSENIIFLGAGDKYLIRAELDNANVFVQHSVIASNGDSEGMPTAIIEAMSMELPILSTFHSGIPEVVESGLNGLLVDEGDLEGYVNAINEIYSWRYLEINREKIVNGYSLIGQTAKLINIFQSVILQN